jgi:hypothetical protein
MIVSQDGLFRGNFPSRHCPIDGAIQSYGFLRRDRLLAVYLIESWLHLSQQP